MDAFSTAAIACEAIYKTLESSAAFPSESRSLAARFKYDARILRHFCNHFESLIKDELGLSDEDRALLEESTSYLSVLLQRVEVCKSKLTAQGRWPKEMNRLTWVLRRGEVKELEAELYEWTKRLDLRLVALPERARTVMSLENEEEVGQFNPRLAAKIRLQKFLSTTPDAKKRIWERLFIDEAKIKDRIKADASDWIFLAEFEEHPIVLEFRNSPIETVHDEITWKESQTRVGEFVAALNFLDSTISGLLKCSGFYYSASPNPGFGLLHQLPQTRQSSGTITTFIDLLRSRDHMGRRQKLRYSLNQRIEFATKLATAVLFIHAIGWVHKSIRPQNVLILGKGPSNTHKHSKQPTWLVSSPYLIGFEIARNNAADTVPGNRSRLPRNVAIYMHPSLQDATHVRYTMAHDIYSLGVLLLELGIWSPLVERPELRGDMEPADLADKLLKLTSETEVLMGRRFRQVVQICLSQGGEGNSGSTHIISEVLEKLEDIAQAV